MNVVNVQKVLLVLVDPPLDDETGLPLPLKAWSRKADEVADNCFPASGEMVCQRRYHTELLLAVAVSYDLQNMRERPG